MYRFCVGFGALNALIAVGLGAFGAHALKDTLSPEMLAIFRTGVDYQFAHALALLVLGVLSVLRPHKSHRWSAYLMLAGMLVFSGTLYLLSLTGGRWWGAITPLGGLSFLASWLLLLLGTLSQPARQM